MVHSPKPVIITDDEYQTGVDFTLGKTICYGSLEFITDGVGSLSLSTKGNDSGAIFMEMAQCRSPSLHTILKDFADKFDIGSTKEGSPGIPISQKM
jgi:hypothetical protein